MAHDLSNLERALCRRMNAASVLFIDNIPSCILCNKELPSVSQYNSHIFGACHVDNSLSIYDMLVEEFLSPGIQLLDDTIRCILCEENFGNRFDWRFRHHITGYSHRRQVKLRKQQGNGFDSYYDGMFNRSVYKDLFVVGVSRAGIFHSVNHDLTYCYPCNRILPQWSQFLFHVKGSLHMDHIENQLNKLADCAGLVLGIIIEDGLYKCKLCNVAGIQLGSVFSLGDVEYVYSHIQQTYHAEKYREQIDNGLETYHNSSYNNDNEDSYSSSSDD